MQDTDVANLRAAIAALEAQRATLGDIVLELAAAPLRARLASLQRPAGLRHRQVAVLFVDVVGSTAMAQGLDAEDTLDVLGGALHRMADIVQAHQGRVLRFTGDGVKAAFGMDEAREDDAERAVRAGLAMLEAGRAHAKQARISHAVEDFAVRVGVHTGDVALGAGVEADNTAVGSAVNIAARMEQSAPSGALRISHDTWNLVRGLFEVEPQPPLQIKGVDAPMRTYLVRTALNRHAAGVERGLQGLSTPMVGRQDELQRLQEAVASASVTGGLQALTLVGDAGLGKSRLLRELQGALSAEPAGCQVLAIRSQPDGMLRPWGLLRSLLAVQCGVADTDSAQVARSKVQTGLSHLFDERGERQAQLIGQLSGLDFGDSPNVRGLDPRSLRDQALAALIGYLRAVAIRSSAPTLLLIEDLHWADDSSLDLLQHLMAHAAQLPLALVMTARPALLSRRPDWGTPETIVPLSPLAPAQSDELAQALLQRMDDAPAQLTELIVGRAEGNPYYMEELVRRLIDDGVIVVGERWTVQVGRLQMVQLPGTLVGLLQARLDALPANERLAARQASVIGHVFWDDALRALDANSTRALPALQRAAFVRDHETSDFEGTAERQFDHHLLHQVTYDTLLKSERRLGHGAVARWLTERTLGRGAEFLAMTGEHAERAGETALAIDCFEQAGKEAQKRFANTAAESWLRRAVGLLGHTAPVRRFELLEQVEKICDRTGNRLAQDALHADMALLLEHHPDDACQARMLFCTALLAERRGDRVACEQHARSAIERAERCEAAVTAAQSYQLLGFLFTARADPVGALAHLDSAVSWATKIADPRTRDDVKFRAILESVPDLIELCRFDEARKILQATLSRAEALGMMLEQYFALNHWCRMEDALGHFDRQVPLLERQLALARTMGSMQRAGRVLCWLAHVHEALGDYAAALDRFEEGLPLILANGDRTFEALARSGVGRLHFKRGDITKALQWLTQAQDVFDALEPSTDGDENHACVALCHIRLGERDAALSIANRHLNQVQATLTRETAYATLQLRWTCQQVLEESGDAIRAALLLQQLFLDVQARAAELTDATDRERLIKAMPVFRDIVAAHARLSSTQPD